MNITMAQEELNSFYIRESQNDDWKKHIKYVEGLRISFVKEYTVHKFEKMPIDTYSIGLGKGTFCYDLEIKYADLGQIRGSPAARFGVYYGTLGKDKTKKYRVGKKSFGSNVSEAYIKVRAEIVSLMSSERKLSQSEFKANLISPMVKLKVLSIYRPDDYLPIFSDKHLAFFINELGLVSYGKDHITLQECLLRYKSSHPMFSCISNMEFSQILYKSLPPTKGESDSSLNDVIINNGLIEHNITEFENIGAPLNRDFGQPKGKGDYTKQARENRKTGAVGENLVMEYEREKLTKAGRKDLSEKIKQVSEKDDGLGYDIRSYTTDGKEIYIEVKASKGGIESSRYFFSRNEKEVAKTKKSYWLYIISDLKEKKPKLLRIKEPFGDDKGFRINLEPTQYLFEIQTT